MKPNKDYILKDTMHHTDIVDFIKPWMKKKNIYTRTYNYTLLTGLFAVAFYVGLTIPSEGFPMKFISDFFLGALLGFLMIPLH